ncbi:MAG: hypothetical protein OEY07_08560, partial [Gammaproteobacteria bacterium]|nr:hypothetical protein [Gammaproteobacteria bacterium]
YIKLTGGFIADNDTQVTNNTQGHTMLYFGVINQKKDNNLFGSYLEIGAGYDERFRERKRSLLINAQAVYKISNSPWRFVAQAELNSGPGADDFRMSFGFRRDFDFLINIFADTLGIEGASIPRD